MDDVYPDRRNEKEAEADQFSADFLIPPEQLRILLDSKAVYELSIKLLAAELHIAPGIIVGRLQHEKQIPFNRLNHLKQRLDWERFEEVLSGENHQIP